jgi:hypothetical protein
MRKLILIVGLCFLVSGCSLLKVVSAPFKNSVNSTPQSTERNRTILRCQGEIKVDETGKVLYCSKGFYSDTQTFEQTDRKLTLREKIGQFIAKGAGYLVWGAVLAGVLTFFGFGWIVSGFFNMVFGLGKVLRQTVQGIQNARKNNVDLSTALSMSQDENVKKFIADFKEKNNIK